MYYDLNFIASEDVQTFKQRFAFPHSQTFCLQRQSATEHVGRFCGVEICVEGLIGVGVTFNVPIAL
jgi:hypothetical protein